MEMCVVKNLYFELSMLIGFVHKLTNDDDAISNESVICESKRNEWFFFCEYSCGANGHDRNWIRNITVNFHAKNSIRNEYVPQIGWNPFIRF